MTHSLFFTCHIIYALIFLFCWNIMQPVYGHYSQPDPCPTLYNNWQTDKAASDAAETAYNTAKTEAAEAISTTTVAAGAVAAIACRKLKGSAYLACVEGAVAAAVATVAADHLKRVSKARDAWRTALGTTRSSRDSYNYCRANSRRDCDRDGAHDDCINTTHAETCSCNDGYSAGSSVYERSCGCEARHPH